MLHQTLSLLLILAPCVAAHPPVQRAGKPESNVEVLGDFVRFGYPWEKTFGDTLGYSLQLWKEEGHIFGLFAVYVGPPADPPTGLLEDVKFNPRSGRFSFSARLSLAFVRPSGDKWVPTQDRFTFKGRLTGTEVSGTLRQFDVLRSNQPPILARIKLRRSKRLTADLMPAPASYEEWKKWADEILRRRGPQTSPINSDAPHTPELVASASLKKPAAALYFIDAKTGWVLAKHFIGANRLGSR